MSRETIFTGEIIGTSGAGKSTLSGMLNSLDVPIEAGITIWGLPKWLLAKGSIVSFPAFLRTVVEDRAINIENGKQIVRLNAFYDYFRFDVLRNQIAVKKSISDPNCAVFLDEGVVFALSKMSTLRQDYKRSMKRWEENILDRWSRMLDAIIWLDAPNSILTERIRSRSKEHRMKHKSDHEVNQFLDRYRAAYLRTVDRLQKRGEIEVLKFDTGTRSLDSIADELASFVRARQSVRTVKTNGKPVSGKAIELR
jgi:deoxyadenosine/deoxycytidine kinase